MTKKLLFFSLLISVFSCNNDSTKGLLVTPSGYNYEHVDVAGDVASPGDFVYFTMKIVGDNGSVLQELGEGPNMPIVQLPTEDKPAVQPNPVVEMMGKASVGDTLKLTMPIDSMPNAKGNPQLEGMQYIVYVTHVTDIKDEAAYKADMEAKRLEAEAAIEAKKARIPEIDKMINSTLKDYNAGKLDVQTTENGIKYVIHEAGEGENAQAGDKVTVEYYGAFLDGKMFDNSYKRGNPFQFTVGRGEVIQGWDQGLPLLKPGGSATLIIPYELAYGEAGSPPTIPAKSDLAFYVELKEIN